METATERDFVNETVFEQAGTPALIGYCGQIPRTVGTPELFEAAWVSSIRLMAQWCLPSRRQHAGRFEGESALARAYVPVSE